MKDIAVKQETAAQKTQTEQTITELPNVDILETPNDIQLMVEMPGVANEDANVTVENNVLTIEGNGNIEPPKGEYELLGREYSTCRYRRDFTLSDQVDADKIKAHMKYGLLRLIIPKRAETKTRKIEIAA
ncbi:MAG: Hsp20/alpha crystallin family protein [Lentisphaerae bacterium]|nr:Hsp20/alpha crystallin family protein [Lentisphaerota bacterium]